MRRARSLTETDRAIWASYAQRVSPLPGAVKPNPLPHPIPIPPTLVTRQPAVTAPTTTTTPPPPKPGPNRRAPLTVGDSPGGIDRATWTRFRSGKLPAARTLDLHGRTAQRAHAALDHFLFACIAEGIRCVEVITGRGSGESTGIIRREFPLWLNQPHLRPLILGAAHPHALNPGSVRLLLRRARTP